MSRLEFEETPAFEEVNQHTSVAKLYNQATCGYCFCDHTSNMVGTVSVKADKWFCGPACQTMYLYDNKLVRYTPDLTMELERMRKRYYSSDKLEKKRQQFNK